MTNIQKILLQLAINELEIQKEKDRVLKPLLNENNRKRIKLYKAYESGRIDENELKEYLNKIR